MCVYLSILFLWLHITLYIVTKTNLLLTTQTGVISSSKNWLTKQKPTSEWWLILFLVSIIFTPSYTIFGELYTPTTHFTGIILGVSLFFSITKLTKALEEYILLILVALWLFLQQQNILLIVVSLEFFFYLFFCLILLERSQLVYKNVLFVQGLLTLLFINFLTTLLLYFGVFSIYYYYGSLNLSIISNHKVLFFLLLGVFLKLSGGPWLFWLTPLYILLPRSLLYLYTIFFFFGVFSMLWSSFSLIIVELQYVFFFISLMTLIIFFKNFYQVLSMKHFLLYSSYSLYTLIIFLLISFF